MNLIDDVPDIMPIVELGPAGKYRTPDAIQCLGISLASNKEPPRLHLQLEGEYELVVPLTQDSMRQLVESALSHGAK